MCFWWDNDDDDDDDDDEDVDDDDDDDVDEEEVYLDVDEERYEKDFEWVDNKHNDNDEHDDRHGLYTCSLKRKIGIFFLILFARR